MGAHLVTAKRRNAEKDRAGVRGPDPCWSILRDYRKVSQSSGVRVYLLADYLLLDMFRSDLGPDARYRAHGVKKSNPKSRIDESGTDFKMIY